MTSYDYSFKYILLSCETCKMCKALNSDDKALFNFLIFNFKLLESSRKSPSPQSAFITRINFTNYLVDDYLNIDELHYDINSKSVSFSKKIPFHEYNNFPHPFAFKPYAIKFPILIATYQDEWDRYCTQKPGVYYPGAVDMYAISPGYKTVIKQEMENSTRKYELVALPPEDKNTDPPQSQSKSRIRFVAPSKFKFFPKY